jgi:hypothetical protein
VEVPYKTLHGIGHYQRKAKRKRPRPRQAKKTPQPRRTLFSSAPAASTPAPPQGGTRPPTPCGSSARTKAAWGSISPAAVASRAMG